MEGSLVAYKVFTNGSVLNASEVNDNLMNQAVITFTNSTARASAITSPVEGMVTYLADTDIYEFWNGSAWTALVPASGAGTGNAIINGAFEINQRGFTTGTANGQFVADRFPQLVLSASGFTSSLVANVGGAGLPENIPNLVTMAGTLSDAANGAIVMSHRVENVTTLAGQNAVLSFYAKGSAAGTIGVRVAQSFGSGGSSSVSVLQTTQAITTDFVRYEFTFAMPSISGKTLGAGHNIFIAIDKNMGTAIIGGGYAPVFTGTLSITGLQLEAGSTATAFRRNANSLQGELAACQRYYYRVGGEGTFTLMGTGQADATTTAHIVVPFKTSMRVAPTSIDFSTIALQRYDNQPLFAVTAVTTSAVIGTRESGYADCTVASGLTAGSEFRMIANSSTSGFIGFSAEL
jgi:hypothetical protein